MHKNHYPPPLILLASHSDIPDLVRVVIEAETPGLLSMILYPSTKDKETLKERMVKDLEGLWDRQGRDVWIVKAVDGDKENEKGVITACAIWQLVGYTSEEGDEKRERRERVLDLSVGFCRGFASRENTIAGTDDKKSYLTSLFNTGVNAFRSAWGKHTKHIYLASLMTSPSYQRRGIGTALMEWGHALADKDGMVSLLIASPFGHPLYQHLGWHDVGERLEFDLKEFVEGAEEGDRGWGRIVYYCMVRLPRCGV